MDIVLDGTAFNVDYWKQYDQKAFISECIKSKVFKQYSEAERVHLLQIAYDLIIREAGLSASRF